MSVYQLGEHIPKVHETAWVAQSAEVIGRVELGAGASVWFGVVIRGDVENIRIGRNSNIQDNSVLHADVVLNGARVGRNCIVAAGSVVTEGKSFPMPR